MEINPQQALDLARRNLSSRLVLLSKRTAGFSADQVLDMGDLLDEFAEDSRKAKRKAATVREAD